MSKEDLASKIAWMKYKHPSDSNRNEIKKHLLETRSNRRDWILKESPTISQIFKEYPRLLDYNGDMIDDEFEALFDKKGDNFLKKFHSYYCPQITEYAKSNRSAVYKRSENITDADLRALVILADLLPTNNATNRAPKSSKGKGKGKGKRTKRPRSEDETDPLEEQSQDSSCFLVRILPEGANLPNSVNENRAITDTNVQPYILCVIGQQQIKSFFVQGDGWFLKPHDSNSSLTAFDLLFKAYFVLNVCYPTGLHNFYKFIESFVYDLGTEARSVVTSLHINLTNLSLIEHA